MINYNVSAAVLLLTFVTRCSAANILMLAMPFYSHLAGPANVGTFLQSRGHNVLLAIPPQLKEKLEKYEVQLLLYDGLGDFNEMRTLADFSLRNYFAERAFLHSLFVDAKGKDGVFGVLRNISTKIVQDIDLHRDIENFRPDLIIVDSSSIAMMLTLIPYKLGIPFVMLGFAETAQSTRTPILPTVFPFKALPYPDKMTFLQRLVNTFIGILMYGENPSVNWTLVSEYAPEISLMDLPARAKLWIVDSLDYNSPLLPNVKRVRHLQTVTEPKPLPQELLSFVESADNGVVVVSFGSVLSSVRTVPSEVKYKLLLAFEQTKYKFILQSYLQAKNQSGQFMSLKWLPQFDLLRHPKTKLFITHCGLNGLQEALIAGIPVIGFPIFADQPHNAELVARKGYGLTLDLRSFSVQELVSAINEVITNPSYKAKVEKASAILKSERVPPVEEAAFWINHVLTFGGEHLRSYAQDIPLWKYLGLDIIVFCLLLWHVFVYFVMKFLKFCISRCFGRMRKAKDE